MHSPNLSQEKSTHMEVYHKTSWFSTSAASYLPATPCISKPSLLSWVGFKAQPLLKTIRDCLTYCSAQCNWVFYCAHWSCKYNILLALSRRASVPYAEVCSWSRAFISSCQCLTCFWNSAWRLRKFNLSHENQTAYSILHAVPTQRHSATCFHNAQCKHITLTEVGKNIFDGACFDVGYCLSDLEPIDKSRLPLGLKLKTWHFC